ncbi:hypothetical protein ABZ832_28365 [Streptantibioticus parmotrematis]|uniref:hypothetical protein n=1 Tax=Streptantibioticus parmotrematis TaxID=2873249 RepID=UPI0033C15E5C
MELRPWEQVTEPGTLEDLLRDAQEAGYGIERRTVTSWISKGLLGQPQRRKSRQRGSDAALHSVNQRMLFLLLLDKREQMPKLSSLAQMPLACWLYWGDEYVGTNQALRAFHTWLRDGRRRADVAREGARMMVEQLDHPLARPADRRALVDLLTNHGQAPRSDAATRAELAVAAQKVFEPVSVFGNTGIVRALGHPEAALTLEKFLEHADSLSAMICEARDGSVTLTDMERARQMHREAYPRYLANQQTYRSAAPAQLAPAFATETIEQQFNDCGRRILNLLALHRSRNAHLGGRRGAGSVSLSGGRPTDPLTTRGPGVANAENVHQVAWVPDDDPERDWEIAATLAANWVQRECDEQHVSGVLVLNAFGAETSVPVLRTFATHHVVTTPRASRARVTPGRPVLAYVPTAHTLDFAVGLARGSSLAVVEGGSLFPLRSWAGVLGATDLTRPDAQPPAFPAELAKAIDRLVFYKNNGYGDQFGKQQARSVLRGLRAAGLLDRGTIVGTVAARGASPRAVKNLNALIDELERRT